MRGNGKGEVGPDNPTPIEPPSINLFTSAFEKPRALVLENLGVYNIIFWLNGHWTEFPHSHVIAVELVVSWVKARE
jgi:hypothetical protein